MTVGVSWEHNEEERLGIFDTHGTVKSTHNILSLRKVIAKYFLGEIRERLSLLRHFIERKVVVETHDHLGVIAHKEEFLTVITSSPFFFFYRIGPQRGAICAQPPKKYFVQSDAVHGHEKRHQLLQNSS